MIWLKGNSQKSAHSYTARKTSWNPAGVEPVHWKLVHMNPGARVSGTNWKSTLEQSWWYKSNKWVYMGSKPRIHEASWAVHHVIYICFKESSAILPPILFGCTIAISACVCVPASKKLLGQHMAIPKDTTLEKFSKVSSLIIYYTTWIHTKSYDSREILKKVCSLHLSYHMNITNDMTQDKFSKVSSLNLLCLNLL